MVVRGFMTMVLCCLYLNASPLLAGPGNQKLRGVVESSGSGLAAYKVTLYASVLPEHRKGPSKGKGKVVFVGQDVTNLVGEFEINYTLPSVKSSQQSPILYLIAERGPRMLVSVLGSVHRGGPPFGPLAGPLFGIEEGPVVVNERTTVASGFAFAQFIQGKKITGNTWGMINAVHMAANMADPVSGTEADVLRLPPNGAETSAEATFNSLANVVSNCIAESEACVDLFALTTLPGQSSPGNVMQAIANIARYPWLNVSGLFDLSFAEPVYQPALSEGEQPDSWALFLKFTGNFSSVQDTTNQMNGPGNFAIDETGNLWVSNNYIPQPPNVAACAGDRLIKFYPWGESFPGSPFFGGGTSGAGFGISVAPNGKVWVGNFGFYGVGCPAAPSDSVSLYRSNGSPVSPDADGYAVGDIFWPQATVADRKGNIWIANCGNDTVSFLEKGNYQHSSNFAIPSLNTVKPFSIAIDAKGYAWVTGSLNNSLTVFDSKGKVIEYKEDDGQLTRPMGVASDSKGNVWITNTDWMDMACPPAPDPDLGPGTNVSIALYHKHPDRTPFAGSPFTGGGLSLPWGIAIDGDDTVWVANFGFPFDTGNPDTTPPWIKLNRVSHFCGVNTSRCPPGKQGVGVAISPDETGYTSDALVRNTGIAIDPSGNVWLVNNWKEIPLQINPGSNAIVVMVGAAAPLATPLIGTPSGFD